MPFVSELAQQLPVIDDSNWRDAVVPPQGDDGPAYIPRDWTAQPLGSVTGTGEFPRELLIPRAEWKERIEELERTKTRLSDLLRALHAQGQFVCLNQNPTNYCWCYAVVHAVMIARAVAGEPFVRLSPYSVATLIKSGRNQGGWGTQALERIVREGVASEEFWPQEKPGTSSSARSAANMAAIRNWQQYVAGSRENAALHKVSEWWDLRSRNWDEKMSALLHRLPVASGYSWMGHERCSIDPVVLSNGDTGCVDLDSYTSDGSLDLKVLASGRGAADDACVPRVVNPSNK